MKIIHVLLIIFFTLTLQQKTDKKQRETRDKCNSKHQNCKSLCNFISNKERGKCYVKCYEEFKKCIQ